MLGKDNAASSKMHPVHKELSRTLNQSELVVMMMNMLLDGRTEIYDLTVA